MKKRIWIVIVLIMMLVLNPCYALGESKDEYYRQINDGLNSLETALDSNNLGAAESALRDISSAVYAAARYLAQIGEYDKSVLQIMDNAKAAKNAATGDYSTYLEQAREINSALFGHSGGEPGGEPNYGHEHRCSEWVIITPATCTTKGVASGVCDSGVTRAAHRGTGESYPVVEYYDPCWETVTWETDFDLSNHDFSVWKVTTPATCSTKGIETKACSRCGALGTETRETADFDFANHTGGTTTEGQNIVCLGCGAVLGTTEGVYTISSDDTAVALVYDSWLGMDEVSEAREGTEISLQLSDNAIPETGYYFTGEFSVSVGNVVWASPVTEFVMPGTAVSISALQAEQETLTLIFDNDSKVLPLDAWMQIQFVEGEPPLILYDEATEIESLDVNGDGVSDLLVTFPQDETTNDITLTRLPAGAASGSFAFNFSGPTDHYGTITFSISTPAFGNPDFTLPSDLTTIEESAFEGDTSITAVDAHNCTSIGAEAFKGYTGLTQIRVHPDCQINDTAFTGCGTVYVFAPAGGAAETSCADIDNCVFVAESQD